MIPTHTIPSGTSATVQAGSEDFSSALGAAAGSSYAIETHGYATIGVHVQPPTGGCIQFQGSFTGTHWFPITLRNLGADGYTQQTGAHEDFIGSVASLRYIRFYTLRSGTSAGEVTGRLSYQVTTLEGIEHSAPPHAIGYDIVHKNFNITSSTSNFPVWVPTSGSHRIVVTDINFTVTEATTSIILSDGSNNGDNIVFRGNFKPGPSSSIHVPICYGLPLVLSSAGNALRITQDDGATVTGTVHGYEIVVAS